MSPSKLEKSVALLTDGESMCSPSGQSKEYQAQKEPVTRRIQSYVQKCRPVGCVYVRPSIFGIALLGFLLVLTIGPEPGHSGFWTFYLPNFLKPSGYKEVTNLINIVQREINQTKDHYADIQHFWRLLEEADSQPEAASSGQESSVCEEVLPLFRQLAIEYAKIDYEHFITPLELHYDHLNELRDKWYPEGPAGKTILPREWEQKIYENELEVKIESHASLTETEHFKIMRQQMVDIWTSVKRGLDNSLKCLYLSYAYRQIADDINQLALEMNLDIMRQTLNMLKDAYTRIAKYKQSDAKAIAKINESIQKFQPAKQNDQPKE